MEKKKTPGGLEPAHNDSSRLRGGDPLSSRDAREPDGCGSSTRISATTLISNLQADVHIFCWNSKHAEMTEGILLFPVGRLQLCCLGAVLRLQERRRQRPGEQ